ncbi:hypothetical protein EMPS_00401 [Entomortierella parvispora]|uniref:Uncharacterized protein n=1 Tax=Entomortierella parvispora TaxID=205924 RepID=A0A9P3H0T3_9FUNG|nr:hypothetical protein EMPS_00401 [Entomortierella parvispora]
MLHRFLHLGENTRTGQPLLEAQLQDASQLSSPSSRSLSDLSSFYPPHAEPHARQNLKQPSPRRWNTLHRDPSRLNLEQHGLRDAFIESSQEPENPKRPIFHDNNNSCNSGPPSPIPNEEYEESLPARTLVRLTKAGTVDSTASVPSCSQTNALEIRVWKNETESHPQTLRTSALALNPSSKAPLTSTPHGVSKTSRHYDDNDGEEDELYKGRHHRHDEDVEEDTPDTSYPHVLTQEEPSSQRLLSRIEVGSCYVPVVQNTVRVTCENCWRQFLLTAKDPCRLERHQQQFCRTKTQRRVQRGWSEIEALTDRLQRRVGLICRTAGKEEEGKEEEEESKKGRREMGAGSGYQQGWGRGLGYGYYLGKKVSKQNRERMMREAEALEKKEWRVTEMEDQDE